MCPAWLWCSLVSRLEYFGSGNMMVRPFWGAFPGPILEENSAKSQLNVIFGPCIKVILGVLQ